MTKEQLSPSPLEAPSRLASRGRHLCSSDCPLTARFTCLPDARTEPWWCSSYQLGQSGAGTAIPSHCPAVPACLRTLGGVGLAAAGPGCKPAVLLAAPSHMDSEPGAGGPGDSGLHSEQHVRDAPPGAGGGGLQSPKEMFPSHVPHVLASMAFFLSLFGLCNEKDELGLQISCQSGSNHGVEAGSRAAGGGAPCLAGGPTPLPSLPCPLPAGPWSAVWPSVLWPLLLGCPVCSLSAELTQVKAQCPRGHSCYPVPSQGCLKAVPGTWMQA